MHPFGSRLVFGRSRALFAVALLGAISVSAKPAAAQKTTLTLGNAAITVTSPTAADYAAGWVAAATGVTYTVDATTGGQARTTTVLVRAVCTDLGAGKPLADLQWRRSDLGTWTSITNTDVQVEQRPMVRNGLNDPWSNTIFVRILLNWATDEPNAYSCGLNFTLTQTVP